MRNPLSGLLTSIDVIQSVLPNPKQETQGQYTLKHDDVVLLKKVSDDAMNIIRSGNETIGPSINVNRREPYITFNV